MGTFPSVTGGRLIKALGRLGFEVIRAGAAIISFNILMADALLLQSIGEKLWGEVSWHRF
jgi:hypothetical protein